MADRNPHIRNFVQRELGAAGYRVYTAETADQLGNWLRRPGRMDALVIDPDIPGLANADHLNRLLCARPELAVIFHCLAADCRALPYAGRNTVYVEKCAQSVDLLKEKLHAVFSLPSPM
ncbi:MAG: hypothetical protein HKP58_06595 [Desulfatitalea sp.]|nr:hypothetical protein [Desulfatitalea sp.]